MAGKPSINRLAYVLNIFAVLTLLILVGIYISVGLLPESQETIKNLIQSLISDISAVLIIFLVVTFFLDRKGLSPSSILKEDLIGDLLKRYPTTKSFLNASEATSQFDIVDKLKTSKEVFIVGWSLVLIQKINNHIIDSIINNNTKVKIIITEPKSAASKLFSNHQINDNIEHELEMVLTVVENMRKEITKRAGIPLNDLLEIKFCSWLPSSCLMFANPNLESGSLRLMVYPLSAKTNHTSVESFKVILKKEEPIVFNYFLNEFETLWAKDTISEEQLAHKLNIKKFETIETTVFESYKRNEVKNVYEYKNLIGQSKTIDIAGYTCKTIVDDCRTEIVRSVLNGSHVRIVIIEPNSHASQLIMENSRLKLIEKDIESAITRVGAIISDIENKKGSQQNEIGKFEIRFMNWVPSYSLFMADRELDSGSLKLTIHHMSYYTPDKDPAIRKLIFKSIEKDAFDYLEDQFERIWEKSRTLDEIKK